MSKNPAVGQTVWLTVLSPTVAISGCLGKSTKTEQERDISQKYSQLPTISYSETSCSGETTSPLPKTPVSLSFLHSIKPAPSLTVWPFWKKWSGTTCKSTKVFPYTTGCPRAVLVTISRRCWQVEPPTSTAVCSCFYRKSSFKRNERNCMKGRWRILRSPVSLPSQEWCGNQIRIAQKYQGVINNIYYSSVFFHCPSKAASYLLLKSRCIKKVP